MTHPDFLAYLQREFLQVEQGRTPDWLQQRLGGLLAVLAPDRTTAGWPEATGQFRADVHEAICQGRLGSRDAAGALYIADTLEVGAALPDKKAAFLALGYVIQLSLSDAQWQEAISAMRQDDAKFGDEPADQLQLSRYPEQLKRTLFKHGEFDALRQLFLLVRDRIEPMVDDLLTQPQDLAQWHRQIALLLSYLGVRHFVSLTIRSDPNDGHEPTIHIAGDEGKFVAPPSEDHPILAHLFTPEDIKLQHRKEAFAAEYFAHGFTTLLSESASAQGQAEQAAEYAHRLAQDKLDARQWLADRKSKLFIAPFTV